MRDNAYVLSHDGFLYTTLRGDRGFVARHSAVVLISVDGTPFDVELAAGTVVRGSVAVVAPLVERRVFANGVGIVDLDVMPSHPMFRHFVAPSTPPVMSLQREQFGEWDESLSDLLAGVAPFAEAQSTFDALVAAVSTLLPAPGPRPAQLTAMLDFLQAADADVALEAVADHLKLSPRRLAQLFRTWMGMSFRDYKTWRKQRRALEIFYSRRSLTNVAHDAGFTDSPQFARAFLRWFGQSPSFSRDPHHVQVMTVDATNALAARHPSDR